MGLAPLMLFTTTLLITRNQRILAVSNTRQEDNALITLDGQLFVADYSGDGVAVQPGTSAGLDGRRMAQS
jgi:hypothetical protein